MSYDAKQWSKLLQAIAKGVVVPIVGRDLLRFEVDGREQLLYEYLAAQLAAQLEVECEPSASIDQVVAAYLDASRRNCRDDVNLKAVEILTQIRDAEGRVPVPEPLRKLGAIQPLRLFLSTTVDSLLATARFIHSVIVDDTAEAAVTFSGFRGFHYARAAGGQPQEDFTKILTAIVRERRLKAASQ